MVYRAGKKALFAETSRDIEIPEFWASIPQHVWLMCMHRCIHLLLALHTQAN